MEFFDCFLDILFPPKCPFCGRVLDHPGVCLACEEDLPWTVGAEALRTGPGGLRCAAPLWYEGLARDGILRFKFSGASGAARPLGALIAQCAAEQFSGAFDTVTWVPVSRQRLRKRGYDQAQLLAQAACRAWDTRPVALLEKTVDNPAQSGLQEAAARRANVLGAYTASPAAAGKHILLIDDICTTGATLVECIRTLREAGAADVICAALALTRAKTEHAAERDGGYPQEK